jgi:hypothetical protein
MVLSSEELALFVKTLEARIAILESNDSTMKDDIKKITQNTELMVEILEGSRAAFKVIRWLGGIVRWLGGVAVACAAIWAIWVTWKTGAAPAQH